jgi:hypothetical protein
MAVYAAQTATAVAVVLVDIRVLAEMGVTA